MYNFYILQFFVLWATVLVKASSVE